MSRLNNKNAVETISKDTGPALSARSLLGTAEVLRDATIRIDDLFDRVRELLFGHGPDSGDRMCRPEPENLEDLLLSALETAENIEKNLYGLLGRLNND